MTATAASASFRPDLARSLRLLRGFRYEQTDPDRFYLSLAADSAAQVASFTDLRDALVLDVGGGPGYFADAFESLGATYLALDPAVGELSLHGRRPGPRTVIGSGTALPIATGSVDVCYSSNVLEHVAAPWSMADEMVRVTRAGGLLFCSYNLWYGPCGGHETSPWHYLGGRYAAERYARRRGHRPKNDWDVSLFRTTVAGAQRWADQQHRRGTLTDVRVVARYHPSWAQVVVRVPLLREVATWNVVVVGHRAG